MPVGVTVCSRCRGRVVGPRLPGASPSQPFVDWSPAVCGHSTPPNTTVSKNSSAAGGPVFLSDEETLKRMIPGYLGYCSRRVPLWAFESFRMCVCFFFFFFCYLLFMMRFRRPLVMGPIRGNKVARVL